MLKIIIIINSIDIDFIIYKYIVYYKKVNGIDYNL